MNMGRVTKDLIIANRTSSITTEPGRYENIKVKCEKTDQEKRRGRLKSVL